MLNFTDNEKDSKDHVTQKKNKEIKRVHFPIDESIENGAEKKEAEKSSLAYLGALKQALNNGQPLPDYYNELHIKQFLFRKIEKLNEEQLDKNYKKLGEELKMCILDNSDSCSFFGKLKKLAAIGAEKSSDSFDSPSVIRHRSKKFYKNLTIFAELQSPEDIHNIFGKFLASDNKIEANIEYFEQRVQCKLLQHDSLQSESFEESLKYWIKYFAHKKEIFWEGLIIFKNAPSAENIDKCCELIKSMADDLSKISTNILISSLANALLAVDENRDKLVMTLVNKIKAGSRQAQLVLNQVFFQAVKEKDKNFMALPEFPWFSEFLAYESCIPFNI